MGIKFLKSKTFIIILFVITVSFLLFLAFQQAWRYHLEVDIWGFYFPRLEHFLKTLSFANLGPNEYLPGAMIFFLFPGIVFFVLQYTWQNYLIGLFFINIILIAAHLLTLRKFSSFAPIIFLTILFFAGPIILYRHELFVSIFIILSVYLLLRERTFFSGFFLGIATLIKIYPIFLLPYFLIYLFFKFNFKKSFTELKGFMTGSFSLIILYLSVGSVEEIKSALMINSIKPLHAESVWASFIEIFSKITGNGWVPGLGSNGIFGIDPNYINLPLNFYNYFWIVPMSIFYAYILYQHLSNKIKSFKTEYLFLIILLFTIFSKIITPQYLFWFILIFPLFKIQKSNYLIISTLFSIILLILMFTQYLYPLNYSQLLGIFFVSGQREDLFYVLFVRNLLLIFLFVLTLIYSKQTSDEKD